MCAILQSASLSTMSIAAGIIVTITFQQINGTPNAETGPQSDNQSFLSVNLPGALCQISGQGSQVYETAYPAFPAGRGVIAKQ